MEDYFKSPRFDAKLAAQGQTAQRKAVIADMRVRFAELEQRLRTEDLPAIGNLFPMACLSKRWDRLLMWSHYAKHHTGFVIGFRSHELVKALNEPALVAVRYADDRPTITDDMLDCTPKAGGVFSLALRTKSKEWHYEEEVRLIVSPKREKLIEDPDGSRYVAIPPSAIETVILGCRSELRPAVKAALREKAELRAVSIRTAQCHTERFAVVLR